MIVVANVEDEEVIDTNIARGYKLCRCCVCLEVQRCTPGNDFYCGPGKQDDKTAPITCESCFRGGLAARNINTSRMPVVTRDS